MRQHGGRAVAGGAVLLACVALSGCGGGAQRDAATAATQLAQGGQLGANVRCDDAVCTVAASTTAFTTRKQAQLAALPTVFTAVVALPGAHTLRINLLNPHLHTAAYFVCTLPHARQGLGEGSGGGGVTSALVVRLCTERMAKTV